MLTLNLRSAISTYSRRGTTKPGCDPREHGIIFLAGTAPLQLPGEEAMAKKPIAVQPIDPTITLDGTSRIRYGKTYPIERSVKVKEIGEVIPEHLPNLVRNWREEDENEDERYIYA